MTQYLLSVRCVDGEAGEPMTDEQMRQSYQQVMALQAEMKSAGAWVFGGRPASPASPSSSGACASGLSCAASAWTRALPGQRRTGTPAAPGKRRKRPTPHVCQGTRSHRAHRGVREPAMGATAWRPLAC
jgi:hypothetical protein